MILYNRDKPCKYISKHYKYNNISKRHEYTWEIKDYENQT